MQFGVKQCACKYFCYTNMSRTQDVYVCVLTPWKTKYLPTLTHVNINWLCSEWPLPNIIFSKLSVENNRLLNKWPWNPFLHDMIKFS